MSMIGFPLLLIPLAIYNIIVFLMPGVSFADPVLKLTLMSGAEWPLTLSDILLALGIVVLLLEVIKGARPGAKYLTDHLLSLIVFGGAVAEFLLWPRFGNSTYFLLALLALADFLSGLALRARRGTQVVAAAAVSRRGARMRFVFLIGTLAAREKYSLQVAVARHRTGRVAVSETAVVVVTTSAHRGEAYAANQYIIDRIKREAPIWKREYFTDGASEWAT